MNNHEFKDLMDKLRNSGVDIKDVLEEAALLAADVYANGSDFHTTGDQFIDYAYAHMEAEWDKIKDEPSMAEIKKEWNLEADNMGVSRG